MITINTFAKDTKGFIISAELAIILSVAVVSAVAVGKVLDDYLTVQGVMMGDHIQILCAQFAPGAAPVACSHYQQ